MSSGNDRRCRPRFSQQSDRTSRWRFCWVSSGRIQALRLPAVVVLSTWYVNITAFMATGAALDRSEKLIHYPPGLVERTEAFLFFLLVALAPAFGTISATPARHSKATAIQRVSYAWRHLGGPSDG
jgi:hypothetical protein